MARAGSKLAQVGRQVGPKLPPGGVSARAEIKACAETFVVAPKWLQVASKLAKVGSDLARAGSKLGRLGCQVGPPLAQAGVPARVPAGVQASVQDLVQGVGIIHGGLAANSYSKVTP